MSSLPSHLVLEEDENSLTLSFNGDLIQSRMRSADPCALDLAYSQVMMSFAMFVQQPQRVLMIGLGGGSLVRHLLHEFPTLSMTVVEIDPEVIALRERFALPEDGARLHIVCEDGARFLQLASPRQYDLILMDAFGPDGEPESLTSMDAYRACRRVLTENGVLMVNLLDREPACSRYIGRIWQNFGESVLPLEVECGGNRVVLAASDEVFKSVAASLSSRWQKLSPTHRIMLDGLQEVLAEELLPWMPPQRPKSSTKRRSK